MLDPAGNVYPPRVFLLAVNADGAEIGQLCLSGIQCPCCKIERRHSDKTDMELHLRFGKEVHSYLSINAYASLTLSALCYHR